MKDRAIWVQVGTTVGYCTGELIGDPVQHRGWDNYGCHLCEDPIRVGEWWWTAPFLIPGTDGKYEHGFCSRCIAMFHVRPRHVPREVWLDTMWDWWGAGERWPDWPEPTGRWLNAIITGPGGGVSIDRATPESAVEDTGAAA
jgi:hypothetical protein